MKNIFARCDALGIRMTHQRKLVVNLVAEADDHPDVDTIYRRAKDIDESMSLATVYRTLSILEQHQFVTKLEIGDGRARYEIAGVHHDHLIDTETGDIHEFHDEALEELKHNIAKNMGFELTGHRLELFGHKKEIANNPSHCL